MRRPRIVIGPRAEPFAARAVAEGGGEVVLEGDRADGLVWAQSHLDGLCEAIEQCRGLRWVQLPLAGVERIVEAGIMARPSAAGLVWTCAKGAYAKPVAEHAVALALAGLRCLPKRARARSWGEPAGTSLYGASVTILGGGGICRELLSLMAPFNVRVTVVRRRQEEMAGAVRVLSAHEVTDALADALVVFIALALTAETVGVIGAKELSVMGSGTWLVNVARGRHVDTQALVTALTAGQLAGAALDVTEPEPLPEGHPLWSLPNCLITPHTADTPEMVQPFLAKRISDNVRRFGAGLPLVGIVDPVAGY